MPSETRDGWEKPLGIFSPSWAEANPEKCKGMQVFARQTQLSPNTVWRLHFNCWHLSTASIATWSSFCPINNHRPSIKSIRSYQKRFLSPLLHSVSEVKHYEHNHPIWQRCDHDGVIFKFHGATDRINQNVRFLCFAANRDLCSCSSEDRHSDD